MILAFHRWIIKAQNIPFKRIWLLKWQYFCQYLLLNIFCAYYCHLYIQLCIRLTKIFVSWALVGTAPELCQKGDIFPEKMMEGIFVYVLEYMLTLVSLDKMQTICTSMWK